MDKTNSKVRSPRKSYYYVRTAEDEYEICENKVTKFTPHTHVVGFTFPLTEQEDVERLETAVTHDEEVRRQYVGFLTHKKPTNMSIVQFLPMVFSDEALDGYNFNGTNTIGKCKLPMRGYNIFSHCFIDQPTITTVRNRKKNPAKATDVPGFTFPLHHDDEVERLENIVSTNSAVREKYVNYLRTNKAIDENVVFAIKKLFSDQSLAKFTYHGFANLQHPRKAMKEYLIFTDCLVEAWEDHGESADSLRQALIKATQRAKQHLSSARYYQRYRNKLLEKRKEHQNKKTALYQVVDDDGNE
ncbi:uncharacterized protein LOC129764957 [Toxorhynchites rutilus septentrionalis]|uniref:uncharacterized protein LOC129764957 n=1 Tax=Toxorhynchites rutilus septentrionalis TaxID=329112 RepID=UPI00247A2791|nr:uncharacterized protein LOC129764957 [Toxorhynchites rutilus septentrionalis]